MMDLPEEAELLFYDEDEHETMTKAEQDEMYEASDEYRENLRTGTKSEE